ncbi:TetR/AcrR family transcriptional regulator [Janthinobacterium aquaticum]|uniref:TetR/AcrR family transcriptional regulator n=1 Tax=Janthinobacterium sp. FT58W TaxID=2654254 RepID=UPI00126575FC|nr:TetR/AcrR family transcriptional regulator [Janthinobacterium sp. FT58W]KAB8038228.1 TetR family transcriptional regulator [Janthinobacterium sp. FT58W]
MMTIMQKNSTTPNRKEQTHDRIVDVASRAIRRSGYSGTGVADIMKEAGLTHGGFYAHFESRDALLAEAASRACADSAALVSSVVASAPPGKVLQAMMAAYLAPEHIADIETGCPLAALASEVPRQAEPVRQVADSYIKKMIEAFAYQMPDRSPPEANQQAMALLCSLIGTTVLARAVADPELSAALCAATMKQFAETAG